MLISTQSSQDQKGTDSLVQHNRDHRGTTHYDFDCHALQEFGDSFHPHNYKND